MSNWIVRKSGGTSTASATDYERLLTSSRALELSGYRDVIVVSAPALGSYRVTSLLQEYLGDGTRDTKSLEKVIDIFAGIAHHASIPFDTQAFAARAESSTSQDECLPLGEEFNARQLTKYFHAKGLEATFLHAPDVLTLDPSVPGGITVNTELIEQAGPRAIVGGFHGRDLDANTRKFAFGGSDITGDRLAGALGALRYEVLKDVPGIWPADPRIIADQSLIREMTIEEMRQLAYAGNRVLQEQAMVKCRQHNIPILVHSLTDPNKGTYVLPSRSLSRNPLAGIASRPGFYVYGCEQRKTPSFLSALFGIFADFGVSIDMISTANKDVRIAWHKSESERVQTDLEKQLQAYRPGTLLSDQSLVSVVGHGITRPLTFSRAITASLEESFQVGSIYGPILGGVQTGQTTYYIEKFGMHGERGFSKRLFEIFLQHDAPVVGASTTIDSFSIGTSSPAKVREIHNDLFTYLDVDRVSVTRDGLQLVGEPADVSNVTISVPDYQREDVVRRVHSMFF